MRVFAVFAPAASRSRSGLGRFARTTYQLRSTLLHNGRVVIPDATNLQEKKKSKERKKCSL